MNADPYRFCRRGGALLLAITLLLFAAAPTHAAELPQQHEYQRTLRDYIAQTREDQLTLDAAPRVISPVLSDELRYRDWLTIATGVPLPTGAAGLNLPPSVFMLRNIEGNHPVLRPAADPLAMARLAQLDVDANRLYAWRALRRRAFIVACVDLVMLDALLDSMVAQPPPATQPQPPSPAVAGMPPSFAGRGAIGPFTVLDRPPSPPAPPIATQPARDAAAIAAAENGRVARAQTISAMLTPLVFIYRAVRDDLPPRVANAYVTGLRKLVAQLDVWQPGGRDPAIDIQALPGLWMLGDATDDPGLKHFARLSARSLLADSPRFHPAGYIEVDGGFDPATHAAAMGWMVWTADLSGWAFARQAVDRAAHLRACLSLPDPINTPGPPTASTPATATVPPYRLYSPNHFATVGGSVPESITRAEENQRAATAMLSDDALFLAPLPTSADLETALLQLAQSLAAATHIPATPPTAPPSSPWALPWQPTSNALPELADRFYVPAFFARLQQLQAANSPLLRPPFLRPGRFIENLDGEFLVARQDSFGVVIHTGPIGSNPPNPRSAGFGGGAISTFWTPQSGPVLLGRRRGASGSATDSDADWRLWPTHAVTGLTTAGKVISSARIRAPHARYDVNGSTASIVVSGVLPTGAPQDLRGTINYQRTFKLDGQGLGVESSLSGDALDQFAELYEVIPVFLGAADPHDPAALPPVDIRFRVHDGWVAASASLQEGVTAIHITRRQGTVEITLQRPASVRLSPQPWLDADPSRIQCRNVMIDLLGRGVPRSDGKADVAYRMAPGPPPAKGG